MLVDVDMVTVQILYALYVCIRTVINDYYIHTVSCLECPLMFAVSHMNML